MRLSDAMATGRVIQTPGNWMSYKECAIGVGMAGIGIAYEDRHSKLAVKEWPWLEMNDPDYLGGEFPYKDVIGHFYAEVTHGVRTFDQVIDYVRSVEPVEPEVNEQVNKVTEASQAGELAPWESLT